GARLIRESELEPDGFAELHLELLGEPRRDRLRRDPARLRVADHPVDPAAGFETDLRQLRRLAATRVAADDDHAMLRERGEDLLARCADRQLVRVAERVASRAPARDSLFGRSAHGAPARASSI